MTMFWFFIVPVSLCVFTPFFWAELPKRKRDDKYQES